MTHPRTAGHHIHPGHFSMKIPGQLSVEINTAGFPSPADDHIEGKLDLNEHLIRRPAATFFVRAAGESMRDAGIFDGDLLVIDRGISPQPDDIVIAILHGDLTVKRLKKVAGQWHLAAENMDYPSLPIGENDCEIWGVVTTSIRRHCGR